MKEKPGQLLDRALFSVKLGLDYPRKSKTVTVA
jgi:hypothetical protein